MRPDTDAAGAGTSRRTVLRQLAAGGTALAVGLSTFAGSATAKGRGGGVQRISIPVVGRELVNPCSGETVRAIAGTAELVVHEHTDGAGGTHFVFHRHLEGLVAVGLDTGTTYYGLGTVSESSQVKPPYPETFTLTAMQPIVTHGPEPNALLKVRFVLTVNGNGEVVVRDLDESFECRPRP